MKKDNLDNYVPFHEYAAKIKKSIPTVYRWVREGRISKDDVKIIEVTNKRYRIRLGAKPK